MHLAEPLVVVADAPVVLAQNRPEAAVCPPREPNVIGGAIQLRAPDNDVRCLAPLVSVIANEPSPVSVDFDFIAHRRQPLDEEPISPHDRLELSVSRHFLAPF